MYHDFVGEWVSIETANSEKPIEGVFQSYDPNTGAIQVTSTCSECDHYLTVNSQYVVVIVRTKSKQPNNEKGNHYGN